LNVPDHNPIDIGRIDLMVQDGFYTNRTDFIRTAIRQQLERHTDVVEQRVARKTLDLGLRPYSREDLEASPLSEAPIPRDHGDGALGQVV
jgi:Arc/MetJ-type ribon-helix-helix transcriptional regulator